MATRLQDVNPTKCLLNQTGFLDGALEESRRRIGALIEGGGALWIASISLKPRVFNSVSMCLVYSVSVPIEPRDLRIPLLCMYMYMHVRVSPA